MMLTKIDIDLNKQLSWELEEKLLKISNGFEVIDKSLVLWVSEDLEYVLSLLQEAKIPFTLSTHS